MVSGDVGIREDQRELVLGSGRALAFLALALPACVFLHVARIGFAVAVDGCGRNKWPAEAAEGAEAEEQPHTGDGTQCEHPVVGLRLGLLR